MRTLRAWWARIAGFVRPGDAERDFADELQSHIDLHTDDNIRAGMTPEEARRQALLQVGSVTATRDAHRDRRGLPGLEAFMFDLRIGVRMLVKYPGLTIVGGVAMAFAICVGLVIFQVVSLFTHPTLPLPQGARLVEVRVLDVSANDEEPKILYDFAELPGERVRLACASPSAPAAGASSPPSSAALFSRSRLASSSAPRSCSSVPP